MGRHRLVHSEVGASRSAARSAPSARRASRCSRRGAGMPPRRAAQRESVAWSAGGGAGNGERVARSRERVARNGWRRPRSAWGVRGNPGRLSERSKGGSTSGERGPGFGGGRLQERAGKRDVCLGRLPSLGGRPNEEEERLEAKGERRSSVRERPMSCVAARRVYGRRLHERAERPWARGRASKGASGEAMGTGSASLPRF